MDDDNITSDEVVSPIGEKTKNTAFEVEDKINVVGQAVDLKIVGSFSSTNGRSCCIHKIFEKVLKLGIFCVLFVPLLISMAGLNQQ
jgi:hypothetical protein